MARVAELCRSGQSVSSAYARDPSKTPGEIAQSLYGTHHLQTVKSQPPTSRGTTSAEHLEWARQCGKFEGTKPSELFLQAYYDLLQCLEKDALADCVSPSLTGSTGYCPMTIIAPLNDQLRHMSNIIVRAKKEVLVSPMFTIVMRLRLEISC